MTDTRIDVSRTAPVLDPRRYGVLGRLGLVVARHRRTTLALRSGLTLHFAHR